MTWGLAVENAVTERTESAKTRVAAKRAAQETMDRYLFCDKPQTAPGRFRDPAAQL